MACEDLKTAWMTSHDAYMSALEDRQVAASNLETANAEVAEAEAALAGKQAAQDVAQDDMMAAQDSVESHATSADDAYTEWVECESGVSPDPVTTQPVPAQRKRR